MSLGTLLVLIGTILAAVAGATHYGPDRRRVYGTPLLAVAVVLIGIGVLVGAPALVK